MNKKDLIDAITRNDEEKFWLCVDRKVDLNAITSDGVPMLILAIKFERTRLICGLLVCGANPDATDRSGKTAMDYANEKNYLEAKLLLKKHHAKTSEQLKEEIYRDPEPESGSVFLWRRRQTFSRGAGGGGAGAGPVTARDVEPEPTSLLATLFGMFGIDRSELKDRPPIEERRALIR